MRKLNSVSRMMAGASALAFIVSASGVMATPAPSTYTVSGQSADQVYLNQQYLSNGVLSNLSSLSTGAYLFNYVTVYFTPDTDVTGATFGVYEANFDPVSILYSGAYDPFNPSANAIAGNDDNYTLVSASGLTPIGCGGVCSAFSANLVAGQTYYLFLSTYSSGAAFTTPVSFFATGTTFNWGTYVPTPTSTDIDTAASGGYDASQLGSTLNAVFAGGTLYFTVNDQTFAQNFVLGNSATNTINTSGLVTTFTGDFTDQSANGSLIFTNSATGGSVILSGTNTYTGSTTVENRAYVNLTGTISNTSRVLIKNGGTFRVSNGGALTAGGITNELGGRLSIAQGGTVTDDLDNAGYVDNAGTYNAIVNTNSGTIANLATGVWNGDVVSSTGIIDNAGIWNGNISSSGTLASGGTINGNVITSGDATLYGTVNGSVASSGNVHVGNPLTTGAFANSGHVTIFNGTSLTADGLTNSYGGTVTVLNGGALTSAIDNAGSFANLGTVTSTLNTNSGYAQNYSAWNGNVLSNTGTLINTGVWNGDIATSGAFANTGTLNGALSNAGTTQASGTINGAVSNSGTFALSGNLSGNSSDFNNTGTLNIADNGFNGFGAVSNSAAGTILVGTTANAGLVNVASLSNAGALHMANGRAGDVVNVTGAYTGTAGSVLSFDVDMLTGQADLLNVGTLSGTSTVRLNNTAGAKTYLAAPVVLVSADGGTGTLVADTDAGTTQALATQSLMTYNFRNITGTNDWGIVSSLNTPSLTSLSASLTAYVTAQNLNLADLPEEVFVRDGAYGVNQWMANSWARAYSGDLSLKDAFTISDDYSSGTTTKAKSSQDGVQYGFDAGVYNIHGTGVSLRAGFMGGSTDAKVTDETLSGANVKIDAPNYGYYGALTHKGLRLSVQNRHEILKADVTNPVLGLSNSRFKARSETFSVALSNRFDVSRLFVEPVIGYMTTKVDADTLDIPADQGSVKIASLKSKLIRAGVRAGTSVTTERVIWTPYGELNAWQEDAAKTQTAYVPESGTGAVWLAGQRAGTFGQALVGVTAQSRSNENLAGHLTADTRLGDTLNGWTVRAGVKYRLK